MRDKSTAKEDRSPEVSESEPWTVAQVSATSDRRLTVSFVDGTSGEVDLSDLIFGNDPGVFAALRDPHLFRQVGIEDGAVTWPGELDLAPDAMYDAIREMGCWTP